MDTLISTFHLDLKLLIAQAVNFAAVFLTLYFFLFKPLFKTMRERTAKIEQGLSDAERIEKELKETEERNRELLAKTRQEANEIISEAKKIGDDKRSEMIAKAKEEIGAIINQEKDKMQSEKKKILKEMRKEVADLVAISLEKVLEKKIDPDADREIVEKILKEK